MKKIEVERAVDNLSHRKNRSRRGIGMRRKTAVGIFAVLIAGTLIASAGLLSYYGKIETTATITQALTLNGHSWDTPISYTISSPAGSTYTRGPVKMRNYADSPIPVTFGTTQEWWNGASWEDASDAVTIRYYGKIVLDNKDDCTPSGAWSLTSTDDTGGLLKYYLDGSTFDYEFNATGLTPGIDYSLIYYADQPDRFVDWGGNNPGVLIGTFMTDATTGDIALTTGSKNLGMNLPSSPDANIDEYDYSGTSDSYALHHGAKIWLVPTNDLTSGELTAWNPSDYLFETNLISYHDADVTGTEFMAYQGLTEFWIEYTFASAAMPGSYTITTEIQPSL